MKSTVIVFPGSNCDRDVAVALEKMQFKNQMVWHKETKLPKSDLIVIPGGFSYGDYLRSGAIAGKSLILEEVIKAANSGCLILGICNGFQILTETGLLKGTLLRNKNLKFINKDIHIKVISNKTKFTNQYKNNQTLKKSIYESTIELWNFCKKELRSGENDQIILDEIFLAIDMKIIDKDDLISTLENRFISGDVILTGTDIPKDLLLMANQITELRS